MKKILLVFLKIVNLSIRIIIIFLPWAVRREVLVHCFKYEISPDAHIGLAYVYPKHLVMRAGAVIKHFNIIINLDEIILEEKALIDRSNWITGFPTGTRSAFFKEEKERESKLLLGKSSVITKRHHLDCTNQIKIGDFTTVGGYASQFLTHSVNIYTNRQTSKPITIGKYCFISTNVVLLGGSSIPDYSLVGASALVNKDYSNDNPYGLYVGVPANRKKDIDKSALYFSRIERDVL